MSMLPLQLFCQINFLNPSELSYVTKDRKQAFCTTFSTDKQPYYNETFVFSVHCRSRTFTEVHVALLLTHNVHLIDKLFLDA